MSNFLVSPEQLHKLSGEFDTASKDILNVLQHLDESCNSLESIWNSASKQIFFQNYTESRKYFQVLNKLLFDISQEIETMANRISQADKA